VYQKIQKSISSQKNCDCQGKAALKMLKAGKQFYAKKHCGKATWETDGLSYQKKLCDEWD